MEGLPMSPDRDALARQRIVSEMDENFFVEAGAGSGKTTMLVSRMAAMVEAGIDVGRICAITFTKAAAGEFYDRFQRLLIERSNPNCVVPHPERPGSLKQPDAVTRERCARALRDIDLCFMGTIDSFCGMLLAEHPSEAGIPSDANIVSDEDAAAICRQQYVRISGGDCGEELQTLAKTFRALHREPQDVFVRGVTFLMDNRNVHFNFPEAATADIDKAFEEERKELLRAVNCLVEHPELRYTGNKPSRDAWERIGRTHQALRRRWSGDLTGVLQALGSLKNIRLIPEAMDRYAVSLGTLFVPGGKGKTPKWYEADFGEEGLPERLEKLRYDVSMSFLTRCVPVVEQAMRERGSLRFFDNLYYLRNMLKKDAEGDGKLIRYIGERHSCFLIDEFQDTNPLQAEVFFYLAAEHPKAQWSACVPRKGSLFIVGDPKQSIYRFRGADVSAFLRVKKLFEKNGGAVLSLNRNFRSTRQLCEYFNRVFRKLLPEETENQSRFEEIPLPAPTDGEFQGVYTCKVYTGKAAGLYPELSDPVRIADMIERLAGSSRFLIRGEKDSLPRPIRCSDFMVITAKKKFLGPILAELDARGIPTRVEGEVPFAGNEALREICRLFSAAADADDPLALYGALTGRLLGLTREDILRYRACGGAVSLKSAFDAEACTDEAALRTAEKMRELKSLAEAADSLSPAALFSHIMDDFRLYQTLPAENLEVVCYALELLRGAERSGQLVSLKDAAAWLNGLLAGASGEERCLSLTADSDRVHLANLHKVKGLEAPIVILAAAPADKHAAAYRMQHGEEASEGWLFSLAGEQGWNTPYFKTDDYPGEKAAEGEALAAEGQRLIYVAATRARNALILCSGVKLLKDGEKPDSKWEPIAEAGLPEIFALLPEGYEQAEREAPIADAAALYEAARESAVLIGRPEEKASYAEESPSRQHSPSKLAEAPEQDPGPEAGSGSGVHRFPTLLGTMTHKLMEMLVTAGGRLDVQGAAGEIVREYLTPEAEDMEELFTQALLKVAETMRAGGYAQTNGLPQDMLTTLLAADEVYCELPFSYLDETEGARTVWNGVMDVVYLAGGKWHIVDYKTNADGSDLDLRYREQLDAYVKAFRATAGYEADAMTYHIDI